MTITRSDLAAELAATRDIDQTAAAQAVAIYAEQMGIDSDELSAEDAESVRQSLDAHMAHDASGPLDTVYDTTAELARARREVEEVEHSWRAAIRAALADGQRVVDIAEAAGISRERVYQIRDGRR